MGDDREDIDRLRYRLDSLEPERPGAPVPGGPAFIGQITTATASIAVGQFLKVHPVTLTGPEVEGGAATVTVDTASSVLVDMIGPHTPKLGDYLLCKWVDYRWAAELDGCTITTLSGFAATCAGAAIPGLVVTVYAAGTTTVLGTATTNSSGTYTLSFPASGTTVVDVGVKNSSGGRIAWISNLTLHCGPNTLQIPAPNVSFDIHGACGPLLALDFVLTGPNGVVPVTLFDNGSHHYVTTLYLPIATYTWSCAATRYATQTGSAVPSGSCFSPASVVINLVPASGYACFCDIVDQPVKTTLAATSSAFSTTLTYTGGRWTSAAFSVTVPTPPAGCCPPGGAPITTTAMVQACGDAGSPGFAPYTLGMCLQIIQGAVPNSQCPDPTGTPIDPNHCAAPANHDTSKPTIITGPPAFMVQMAIFSLVFGWDPLHCLTPLSDTVTLTEI